MKKVKQAIIIMIVCILGSSSFSAISSMNSLANTLKKQFYEGSHGDNLSIYEDIIDEKGIAENLVALANKYLTNDSNVKELTDVTNKIGNEKSIKALYKLMTTMDTNVDELISKLKKVDLQQQHQTMLEKYESEYKSERTTISTDPYNSMVRAYYDETSGLLGSFFRIFANKPEYFE